MFNNVVLDVFIGLIFIYLLYSMLASILQEVLARWFHLRARMLQKGIRRMLEDDPKVSAYTIFNAAYEIGKTLVRFFKPGQGSKSCFTRAFFSYPSIKYLAESSWNSKPSYLECGNFSSTVIFLLRGNLFDGTQAQMMLIKDALFVSKAYQTKKGDINKIDNETLLHLQDLFLDSNNDIDRFRINLEKWFNDTMDRATGWYTRQNRLMLFLIGLFIAFNFNVDTIAIYNLLSKDKTARQNLVQLAINTIPKYDSINRVFKDSSISYSTVAKDTVVKTVRIAVAVPDSILLAAQRSIQSDIDKASSIVSLGKPDDDSCRRCAILKDLLKVNRGKDAAQDTILTDSIQYYNKKFQCSGNPYQNKNTRWFGWILTALAISMGAPFWFDLLSKLVSLRSSNKPREDDDKKGYTSTGPASSPIKRVG